MNSSKKCQIHIVGAGLTGPLLALMLKQSGHDVILFEKRKDPRLFGLEGGRSINLAISQRGLRALGELGLDNIHHHLIPMPSRMIHHVDGTLQQQPYGVQDSQCINSLSRAQLNIFLLDAAESARIPIHFEHEGISYNENEKKLTFVVGMEGEVRALNAERVICTDGANSKIREEFVQRHRIKQTKIPLGHDYKELDLPSGPNGEFLLGKHFLHIWPRKSFMLIALPNQEGNFTCTLFLAQKRTEQIQISFEDLSNPEKIDFFFQENFPDIPRLIPDYLEQFQNNPQSNLTTLDLETWSAGDRLLFLGDAAHAIVPFYGQGMNACFEDVRLFGEFLRQNPEMGWAQIFRQFSEKRKLNTDAIAKLAIQNFIEMRDLVGDKDFLKRKELEKTLMAQFPHHFKNQYSLVSFSHAPYAYALWMGDQVKTLLDEITKKFPDIKLENFKDWHKITPFMEEFKHKTFGQEKNYLEIHNDKP